MSTEATPAAPVTGIAIAPAAAPTPAPAETPAADPKSTAPAAPVVDPKASAPETPAADPKVEPKTEDAPAPENPNQIFSDAELNTLESDFASNKDFTEESLKILEKKGISAELARDWAQGREAQIELVKAKCALAVGGEDKLNAWRDWASRRSPEEIEAINSSLAEASAHGPSAVAEVVRNSYATYIDEVGQRGQLTTGSPGGGAKPFRSEREYLEAFADPRYRTSESYRLEVEQRLIASQRFQ